MDAYIFYDVPDRAFERAATTHAGAGDNKKLFHQVLIKVKTKHDFVEAWGEIRNKAIQGKTNVLHVCLYTHASKQTDGEDGLEFANAAGSGTLTKKDIENLPKLPWHERHGQLLLFGCNTGLVGERTWCPAEVFAKSQGVPATGQTGFTYFSRKYDSYEPITSKDAQVHLAAYKRGKNGLTGNGERMKENRFNP